MERKEDLMQVLNDLLKINTEKIEEFIKAIKKIDELEVKMVLMNLVDESRDFGVDLALEILKCGGNPNAGVSIPPGKFYRRWAEVKEAFAGNDLESILNACEFAEGAAQNAYLHALDHDDLTEDLRQLIRNQQTSLQVSEGGVIGYREMKKLFVV